MLGIEFKIIRMWANVSQTKLMEMVGKKSRTVLYNHERSKAVMPLRYVDALSDLIKLDLRNNEVVKATLEKIPERFKDLKRRLHRYNVAPFPNVYFYDEKRKYYD